MLRKARAFLFLHLTLVGGCTNWRPVALPTPQDTSWAPVTDRVRVVRVEGDTLFGDGATMRGDSLWLTHLGEAYTPVPRDQLASIRRFSRANQTLLVVGIAGLAIIGIGGMIAMQDFNDSFGY